MAVGYLEQRLERRGVAQRHAEAGAGEAEVAADVVAALEGGVAGRAQAPRAQQSCDNARRGVAVLVRHRLQRHARAVADQPVGVAGPRLNVAESVRR